MVPLAAALLVGAARVAVEQARLAEQRGDPALVGELGAVVGEHEAEGAAHAARAERRARTESPASAEAHVPSATGMASRKPVGPWWSASGRAESALLPTTASISQAPARPSPGSAPNAACDPRAERRPAPAGADLRLGP